VVNVARIRTIKPSFFRHEGLQDLERANPGAYVMLVFAGLWTQADNQGRFEWRPRQLKLDILPFIDFDLSRTLDLLSGAGFVVQYDGGNGKEYGAIRTFRDHQHFGGKEATEVSKLPAPPAIVKSAGSEGKATGKDLSRRGSDGERDVAQEKEKEKEGNGSIVPSASDDTTHDPADHFDLTWNAYPKRAGGNSRKDALKAWMARRRSGVDWDVMHDGTLRYAAFCLATGKIGTEFVMQGSRFYGPSLQYAEPWEVPKRETVGALDESAVLRSLGLVA